MGTDKNEDIKKPQGTDGQAKAPAKKKLSVVFRSQNSQSMKELPRGLRKAVSQDGAQKSPAQGKEPVKKGPRPLPPGTKPVKPAVFGEEKPAEKRTEGVRRNNAEGPKKNREGMRQEGSAENSKPRFEDRDKGDRFRFKNRNEGERPERGERTERGDRTQGQGDRFRHNRNSGDQFEDNSKRQAGGQKPDAKNRDRRRGGKPATGENSAAFDEPASKPSSGRNKNAHVNDKKQRDKKDKYKDDISDVRLQKPGKGAFIKPEPKKEKPEDDIKVIILPESLTIRELADKLKIQPSIIVKKLFLQGKMVTPNTDLSYEEAEEIAMEYDILCEKEEKVDVIAEILKEDEENEKDMVPRSPVVCVMGHVDHGKTSLLDAIRQTNVTAKEAGGITQHIGASVVRVGDRKITFLDTPGHEAFTAMRLRGAQSTDIAILVVAADDGVKPQTIEAINHAKAAGVEIVVAINKIDKPAANIDRVKQELAEQGLISEDWGGSVTMVPVSAKSKEGIADLLDMVLLEADVLELKANPNRKARGIVIEAELDKGRGPVATVLVQKGTLKVGDNVAAGASYGKVRAMIDDKGNRVKKAGPSTPVEILGLNDVPNAGEIFMGCDNEKDARNIAETFISENKNKLLEETKQKMNLDDLFDQIKAGNVKELPIIVKADVQGSVEAVKQSLYKLSNDEVAVNVIHSGVGAINESDVNLASASNAIIIGFNIKPDATAKGIAEQEKVDIRLYKVIYQAIEDIEAALTGMLAPIYEEKVIGHAIVRQLFKASGVGTIAGSYVTDGLVERGASARIFRGKDKLFEGPIASVKRFKDDVKEVKTGYECGLVFEGFSDLAEDDNIEVFKMVEVPRTMKSKN